MTGNTILLALALSGDQVDGLSAIRSGIALGSYFLGAVLGTIIVSFKIQNRKEDLRRKAKGESEIKALEEAFEKEQWPPEVNVAILIEGLILLLFGLFQSVLDVRSDIPLRDSNGDPERRNQSPRHLGSGDHVHHRDLHELLRWARDQDFGEERILRIHDQTGE